MRESMVGNSQGSAASQSGRGLPHSKTLRNLHAGANLRQLLACVSPLALAALLLLASGGSQAAIGPGQPPPVTKPGLPPVLPRIGARTNPVSPLQRAAAKTNAAPALAGKTNLTAAAAKTGTNAASGLLDQVRALPQNKAFYPVVGGVVVCLVALVLLRLFRSKSKPADKAAVSSALAPRAAARSVKAASHRTVQACTVLDMTNGTRQVWQFEARSGGFALAREQKVLEGESLPSRLVAKDWRGLFRRKLNVAWLPPEKVFLRVAQFPRSDFNDTLNMVELQLEKLSPMPVAQVVWSIHILPHATGDMQTVVVMIVGRDVVEGFLGKLEGEGFLADRLELPVLDQLQTVPVQEDGAWIFPETGGGNTSALVAWWHGGVLQNLDLLVLPPTNRPAHLREQLMQMAWAGELEGWLTSPPNWHLVADAAAADWEPALKAGLERPVEVVAPLPAAKLAAATAQRAAAADSRANLLPAEFATRYQQQFWDRLWMRGVFAIGALYLVGVAIYMALLTFANYHADTVESEVKRLGPTYTNAIQLKAKYEILQERNDLKFAALDCWNAVAKLLPESATLDNMNFSGGKRLTLNGTAPADQIQRMLDFDRDLRRTTLPNGELLFDPNKGTSLQFHTQLGAGQSTATWNVELELKRGEDELQGGAGKFKRAEEK